MNEHDIRTWQLITWNEYLLRRGIGIKLLAFSDPKEWNALICMMRV